MPPLPFQIHMYPILCLNGVSLVLPFLMELLFFLLFLFFTKLLHCLSFPNLLPVTSPHFFLFVLQGSVSYVTQEAWIQNMTIKDNILYGKECDNRKYKRIIKNCCLKQDLKILTAGDMTEIGEQVGIKIIYL
jgi:hypothetical protein